MLRLQFVGANWGRVVVRIKLVTAMGVVAAASVSAQHAAIAQSPLAMSREAVEREIAAAAAQMAMNPPSYPNATFLSADARGLTLFLQLRFNRKQRANADQFASQILASQCQSPALRRYTDEYGVVVDLNIATSDGKGSYRFQINRDACVRTTGVSFAPSGAQGSADGSPPATPAAAQGCAAYVGQTVQPQSFDDAISAFARLTPKSEFETTAQFEARQAQALGGSSGPLIIEKVPESRDYFRYDADAQVLRIAPYAFDNTNFPAWDAFYSLGMDQRFGVSTGNNIDVVISTNDRTTGSYRGQNSFGANATIQQVTRSVQAIFERGPDPRRGRETLFPSEGDLGKLSMTPDEARLLKPSLRIALVANPFAPYVVRGTNPFGKPSLQSPQQVTMDFTILMADIQCGLVMDQQGRVLGAYPTS